ncbi:DUF4350 domain-containing protein [Natronococcus occultus]|uniref:DUF4350 domain-containing protein n=1 Tax=Natronococcus occultus SP4 TaxID=694430 RepID=L0K2Q2_9EURY|nr:DUF4350 domain-containing protein [Natronococcus occultus]AGB38644.1 hypothetical protein Natoc_2886 [Natronococcus occultus SP4]
MNLRSYVTDRDGIDWPAALLVALGAVVLVGLFLAASTSSAAFGPYNPAWDGTDDFREVIQTDDDTDGEIVRDTDRYADVSANETTAIVAAPDESYAAADAARVGTFVENGGTLVVLENFGTDSNDLLDAVGADARTNGSVLHDEQNHAQGPTMPIATWTADHDRTAGVDQLSLNYATAVEPNGATVLVGTSDYAHLAESPGTELEDDTGFAAYPVATVEDVGAGEVVVVGDPSITINAMYDEPDNAAFLQRQYADDDRVLFDLSHGEELPPLAAAMLTLREVPALQALVGLFAVVAVLGASNRTFRDGVGAVRARLTADDEPGSTLSDDERAELLRERHPEWDDERIRETITALNRSRSKHEER